MVAANHQRSLGSYIYTPILKRVKRSHDHTITALSLVVVLLRNSGIPTVSMMDVAMQDAALRCCFV